MIKRTLWSFVMMACVGVTQVSAQDLTDMTLDFTNLTSTNVNQTVNEITTNEKEVEFGDYDNDGDLDVLMAVAQSDFGQRRNKLYRNDNGVLNEVSGAPVIPGFSNTDTSRSAFFRDYNNDGFLDIIIINDSNSGTGTIDAPGRTKLYVQNNGVFVNVSNDLGGQTGAACNGVSADFDGNGLADLMMCNYPNTSQDSLSLNGINGNPAGIFTVVTNTHYIAENRYGVHSEGADMNGDGLIDIMTTNRASGIQEIVYNNLNGMGSGDGDFRYTGSRQIITEFANGNIENGMFPADFDGDGDQDLFFANFNASRADAILENTGNAANGFAQFTSIDFAPGVTTETHKVSRTDLDGDGKIDVVVMDNVSQPRIYRNVSVLGDIRFVEWTENMFTNTQDGWHANSADITGNSRPDLVVGATNDDFLYENNATSVTQFDSLAGGVLPNFHNGDPLSIVGQIGAGETLQFIILGGVNGVPLGSILSTIARSTADIDITLLNGTTVVASSARADVTHEGFQYTTPSNASLVMEITSNATGVLLGDVNGDGSVNLLDVQPFVDAVASGSDNPAADLNGDGAVNLLDVDGFVAALTGGGGGTGPGADDFVVEFLSN